MVKTLYRPTSYSYGYQDLLNNKQLSIDQMKLVNYE